MTHPAPMQLRRHLMSTLQLMSAHPTLSRSERQEIGREFLRLAPAKTWFPYLIKELAGASPQPEKRLEALCDLFMEMGELHALREPLYHLVTLPAVADEVKDHIHIILRSLGDDVDPEFFFEHMKDPEALLEKEAQRIFQASAENPDALTEFLDAFMDLEEDEIFDILSGIERSIPPTQLAGFALPLLLTLPDALALRLWCIQILGESGQIAAAWGLHNRYQRYPTRKKIPAKELKAVTLALKKLQLAGAYTPQDEDALNVLGCEKPLWHLNIERQEAYATYPSADGHQALILLSYWSNGDISLMLVVGQDTQGLAECIVHHDLTQAELNRWLIRFDDDEKRFPVDLGYLKDKVLYLEALNFKNMTRPLPHEYTCWRSLLFLIEAPPFFSTFEKRLHAKDEYQDQTALLFDEPVFQTWYLDRQDCSMAIPLFDELGQAWASVCQDEKGFIAPQDLPLETLLNFLNAIETWCKTLQALSKDVGFSEVLQHRLAEVAYFEMRQRKRKVPTLIATEIKHFHAPLSEGRFLTQYLRRSAIFELQKQAEAEVSYRPFMVMLIAFIHQVWEAFPFSLGQET